MIKKAINFSKNNKLFVSILLISFTGLVLDILGSQHDFKWARASAHILLTAESAVIAAVSVWRMVDKLRWGSWGIDVLAIAAIVTAVLLKEYWTAAIIVIMLVGGKTLEDYAENRAKIELKHLLKKAPRSATILRGRKTVEVMASEVHKGDKILIKSGEIVPVDCVITDGSSSFDESSITGESMPVEKIVGDDLLSGSINGEGLITARALHSAADSQYQQIIRLVQTAVSSSAPFVRLADRFALPFTIMSFAIAGGVWFWSGDSGRFLKVLVVATPCPLLLGAPIGLISGMSKAARRGIIIKTGTAMERLAELSTLAFDKTGTLTMGSPTVKEVTSFKNKISKDYVLSLAASLQQRSNHTLADAVVTAAVGHKLKLLNPRGLDEDAGQGISALLGKERVHVGKLEYLKANGASLPAGIKINSKITTLYVAADNLVIGSVSFEDEIRPDSSDMLSRIKKAGVKQTLMLTGDNQKVAETIAQELGITSVKANCLPLDKVYAIEEIPKRSRPVGFVGDGVNDTPALAAADVGIALGARGSTAASESADVVIMLDQISKVAEAIEIAKRTFAITKQTIVIGILLSLGLMGVFATGKYKAVYGAALQEVVDVAVILNALRARRD